MYKEVKKMKNTIRGRSKLGGAIIIIVNVIITLALTE